MRCLALVSLDIAPARQGNDLYVLHGVTLGATGKPTKGTKRHPTIGDRVVIGTSSTILGDITVVSSHPRQAYRICLAAYATLLSSRRVMAVSWAPLRW